MYAFSFQPVRRASGRPSDPIRYQRKEVQIDTGMASTETHYSEPLIDAGIVVDSCCTDLMYLTRRV